MTYKQAVNKVFDQYVGGTLNLPFVIGAALEHMQVAPANFNKKSAGLLRYIKSSKELLITNGRNGGVRRRCDMSPI
jgi:hypothetical protein